MLTEECGTTNCTMMEVGRAISCMIVELLIGKISGNLIMSVVIDVRLYIS